MSLIRKPRFPSSTRAVAIRSFGRQPQKPSFMVVMISLYCSVVSAVVFLFMVPSRSEKFVIIGAYVRLFAPAGQRRRNIWIFRFVKLALYEFWGPLRRSSRGDHFFAAIQAADVDFLRGSDAHSAARAEIFAAAASLRNCGPDGRSAVGPCPCNLKAAELIAVDQDVGQLVQQHEIKQGVARRCVAPAVFVAVLDRQAVSFGSLFEAAVVVGSAAAAILNAVFAVPVVDHLMKQRRGDFLNGTRQRASADVDLMRRADLADPSIFPQGEVTVGFRCGLNGDGRS